MAAAWHREHGLALADPELLSPRVADAEATIGVAPASMEVLGRNGELALEGAAALGWPSAPLRRNAPGCRGACQCAIGCPNNAKNGVHLNALPQACEAGARIVAGMRVSRVLREGGRASGVAARRAAGGEVRICRPAGGRRRGRRPHARRCCAAAASGATRGWGANSRSIRRPGSPRASTSRWCPGAG